MLKRRRRIQKYINALKSKKENLSKHTVLQYSLSNNQQQQQQFDTFNKGLQSSWMEKRIETSYNFNTQNQQKTESQTKQLWHDSEDEDQQLAIDHQKNVYKKLALSQQSTTQAQYEGKLKTFYQKKYKLTNWADTTGDGQHEMDLEDYLDQEGNYDTEKDNLSKQKKFSTILHVGRTTEKHESIITGMDWHGNSVMFTCGYDQKVKIFKVNHNEDNPELKIKLQKDILIDKLPLSNIFYNNSQLYCGTLRKNLAIIDPVKEKITYVTSSFLNEHKKYDNLRMNKQTNQKLLFSSNKISVLDYKNSYTGSLLAGDQLKDVKFGYGQYELFGVTNDALLEWDLRMFKPVKIDKTFLGYTSLQVGKDYITTGSKLGMIYVYENNKSSSTTTNNNNNSLNEQKFNLYKEITNLTTTITQMSANKETGLVCALSKWKNNAARIIQVNTGRCVGNWPTTKTKIQFGNVSAFSSKGDLFGVGSSNGYVNVFSVGDQVQTL